MAILSLLDGRSLVTSDNYLLAVSPRQIPVRRIVSLASSVDWAWSANTTHSLLTGLHSWYLVPPHRRGAHQLRDLTQRVHGTLTNFGNAYVNGPRCFAALQFDGTDDYVNLGSSVPWATNTSGTVSIVFRLDASLSGDGFFPLLGYGDLGVAGTMVNICARRVDTFASGQVRLDITTVNSGDGSTYGWTGATSLSVDTWYHAVIASDGSAYTFYLDGAVESFSQRAGTGGNGRWFGALTSPGTPSSRLGSVTLSGTPYYRAVSIADVAIWSRTLGSGEVAELYRQHRNDYPDLLRRPARRYFCPTAASTGLSDPITPPIPNLRSISRLQPGDGAINAGHPLNKGLKAWWIHLPGQSNGAYLADLCSGTPATLYASAVRNTAYASRPGNYGAIRGNTTSYMAATAGESPQPTSITLSCWVRPDDVTGVKVFLINRTTGNEASGACFYSSGTTIYFLSTKTAAVAGSWTLACSVASALVAQKWTHLCGTYNEYSGVATLYVNGVAANSQSTTAGALAWLTGSGRCWRLGGDDTGQGVVGLMDDFRIHDRALSVQEVRQLYLESMNGNAALLNGRPNRWAAIRRPSSNAYIPVSQLPTVNFGYSASRGLISHWPTTEGNGRPQDVVNRHNGTFVGGVSWSANRLVFNGSTGYMTGGTSHQRLRSYPFSFCAWIRPAAVAAGGILQYGATSISHFITLSVTAGGLFQWRVNAGAFDVILTGGSYVANRTYFVCGVSRRFNIHELYVNGARVNSTTSSASNFPTLEQTVVGATYDWMMGWGDYFNGSIYNLATFNIGLTQQEITQLYQEPYRLTRARKLWAPLQPASTSFVLSTYRKPYSNQVPPPQGVQLDRQSGPAQRLLAYFPLNEGSGGQVRDLVTDRYAPVNTDGNSWSGGNLVFDGMNGRVAVSMNETRLQKYPITMTAWFRASALCDGVLVHAGNDMTTASFTLTTNVDGTLLWYPNDGGGPSSVSGGSYTPGVWTFVAGVSTNDQDHRLYVNGSLIGISNAPLVDFPAVNMLTLGYGFDGSSWYRPFNGVLGPCAIYNRALSADEQRQLMAERYVHLSSQRRLTAYVVPPGNYTGSGDLAVETIVSAGSGVVEVPSYTGSGTLSSDTVTSSGSGAHVPPSFDGSGAVSAEVITLDGSGDSTGPQFTGTGSLQTEVILLSGSGAHVPPNYDGTGSLAVSEIVLAGSGTAESPFYTGSGALAVDPVTTSGSGSVTVPAYTGTGSLAVGEVILSGTGTALAPNFVGTGSLTLDIALASGSGTHVPPNFDGTGSLSVDAVTFAGTGFFAQDGIIGAGALTTLETLLAGTGASVPPAFTATGELLVAEILTSGSGAVTMPAYVATGAVSTDPVTTEGTGAAIPPSVTGTGDLLLAEILAEGAGSVTTPVYSGSGELSVAEVLLSGSGVVEVPHYSGEGVLLVEVVDFEGAATFYLSLEGVFADPSFPSAFG